MALAEQPLGAFLAAVAAPAPAPGAGAAGGVALALGLACARKAIAITRKHDRGGPALAALGERLGVLSGGAVAGGEADMAGFTAYIEALRRPRNEPDRDEAERDSLASLIATGEALLAIADEARTALADVTANIDPSMRTDVAAALALIAAARAIHAACLAESEDALSP